MATGDKKQVVMADDRNVANGVATLGADALLAAAQRPKAGGLYRDDGTTTVEASLAEISTTLQNKAPAGYGLGTYGRPLGANDDLNNITKNGWYYWLSNLPANAITPWSAMFVNVINDGHIVQTIYPFSMPGTRIIRVCTGSIWKPDEYENPPMSLGVEYRTTERYQGKPVYAKLIHSESMPSGAGYIDILPSNTEVPNALISTAIVIRCYGRASGNATIPFYSSSSDFMQVGSVQGNRIRIYTAKAYGGTADITVHYVKSTD